jgi:hypothetical protein
VTKWVDYSFARPAPADIKAAGYRGVCRYLTGQGKALSASERDAIFAQGLDLLLNFEQLADNAKGGYAQGLKDGRAAADAADALHAPRGMAIYFSVDYDTVGKYPSVVADYLKGCKAGLAGRYVVGVYGSYYVVTGALAAGDAKYGWTTAAWSYGHKTGHIFQTGDQVFSHGADVDELLQADIGSWKQGEDMALDPKDPVIVALKAQIDAVHDDVWLDKPGSASAQPWTLFTQALDSIQRSLGSLAAEVAALKAGGGQIDPAVLAQAIAAHVQLVAK